ncbi:MAG TPA: hypothetical protein VLC08_12975 [Chitinolyticbacter sp.]|nr:hypothetical protein [Chitinolyticbacter sp.]
MSITAYVVSPSQIPINTMTLLRLFAAGLLLLIALALAAMPNQSADWAASAYAQLERSERQLKDVLLQSDQDRYFQQVWLPTQEKIEHWQQATGSSPPVQYASCYRALTSFQLYAEDSVIAAAARRPDTASANAKAYRQHKQACKSELQHKSA